MILNENVLEALTAGHLAHLVTLNNDGSPQRDARVALSMETGGKTNGLDNYLVINCRIAEPTDIVRTTFAPDGLPQG